MASESIMKQLFALINTRLYRLEIAQFSSDIKVGDIDNVRALVREQGNLEAIRWLREYRGVSLLEAQRYVDCVLHWDEYTDLEARL